MRLHSGDENPARLSPKLTRVTGPLLGTISKQQQQQKPLPVWQLGHHPLPRCPHWSLKGGQGSTFLGDLLLALILLYNLYPLPGARMSQTPLHRGASGRAVSWIPFQLSERATPKASHRG